jgi:hypothetical protein
MKIEKNIPLREARCHLDKYKIVDELEVGDSILFEVYEASHAAVVRARKGNPERKFATRKEGDGVRLWRTK